MDPIGTTGTGGSTAATPLRVFLRHASDLGRLANRFASPGCRAQARPRQATAAPTTGAAAASAKLRAFAEIDWTPSVLALTVESSTLLRRRPLALSVCYWLILSTTRAL